MKSFIFVFFLVLSVEVCAASFIYFIWCKRKKIIKQAGLSPLHWCTIGLFVSSVLLYIPIFYYPFDFGDKCIVLRPLFLSVFTSLRAFIVDGQFETVLKELKGYDNIVRIPYCFHAALLCVAAPVLTFSNAMSLFGNMLGELRYTSKKNKPFYIMSELNERSVALAKDICNKKKELSPVIVFTDVFEQNEERDYELLSEVRQTNAICLKRDIASLDILSKKNSVELFLMGEDESENVSQGVKIVNTIKNDPKKHDIKVFIFSHKKSAEYIIDSVQDDELVKWNKQYTKADGSKEEDEKKTCFKLRRINEIEQLALNTVPEMKVFDIAQKNGNTLSVLIAGLGSHGIEFFKTLAWFCQFEGYKLKITAIDKRPDGFAESVIRHQCPELLKTNRSTTDGEAYYDIKVISGVDLTTADFDDMISYEGSDTEKRRLAERLRGVNLAIVALGDDDTNIEEAVHIRAVYDRVNTVKAKKDITEADEKPIIYSIVYDEHKSNILNGDEGKNGSDFLKNHKDVPYHISFIGGMSSRFSYDKIYDEELEKDSYEHHAGWADIEEKIHDEWAAQEEENRKNGNVNENTPCVDDFDWYYEAEKSEEKQIEARMKYEKYEYFRRSSIAKELYKRAINKNATLRELTACENGGGKQTCECSHCVTRKKSEHMRWNAYTRVVGYSYKNGIRADRAALHDNLVGFDELSLLDRAKD